MKNAAEQQLSSRHIGADPSKSKRGEYTYQAANGCEVTICFAEETKEGLVQTVLGMLLQDAYREE